MERSVDVLFSSSPSTYVWSLLKKKILINGPDIVISSVNAPAGSFELLRTKDNKSLRNEREQVSNTHNQKFNKI